MSEARRAEYERYAKSTSARIGSLAWIGGFPVVWRGAGEWTDPTEADLHLENLATVFGCAPGEFEACSSG